MQELGGFVAGVLIASIFWGFGSSACSASYGKRERNYVATQACADHGYRFGRWDPVDQKIKCWNEEKVK